MYCISVQPPVYFINMVCERVYITRACYHMHVIGILMIKALNNNKISSLQNDMLDMAESFIFDISI